MLKKLVLLVLEDKASKRERLTSRLKQMHNKDTVEGLLYTLSVTMKGAKLS